jgi:hypothetical protein
VHNASGKFESRWVTLGIEGGNPAVLLKVMPGCMAFEKRERRGILECYFGAKIFECEDVEADTCFLVFV